VAAGGGATITAAWDAVPEVAEIVASVTWSADGVAPMTTNVTWAVQSAAAAAYDDWADGLTEVGYDEDPDGDGLKNLIEYGFGGDPQGVDAPPRLDPVAGMLVLEFPRRTDRVERGLSYHIEYSPAASGWSEVLPVGSTVTAAPFVPGRPGFEKVRVSLAPSGGAGFLRVRVELVE
jgi:hypothetical protein